MKTAHYSVLMIRILLSIEFKLCFSCLTNVFLFKSPEHSDLSTVDLAMDSVFHHSEEEKDGGESQFSAANIWKNSSGHDFFIQLSRRIL